ncbi:MAG: glycosyltransferase, partial [Chloroflexota bacterium]
MRILLVNKFLYPAGGAETVFFNEWRWLEAAGHEVIPFGMAHPGNVSSPYSRFWVSQIDYRHPTPSQLVNLVWSSEAAEKLARLMAETRPHVAHLHNVYHQLSPSILSTLRKAKVPAVMTLHDYKLICPNYRLFTQGQPCQRCVHSHAWHAVRHRCLKDSLAASGLAAVETTLHRRLRSYDSLARLIAPSYFVQEQ